MAPVKFRGAELRRFDVANADQKGDIWLSVEPVCAADVRNKPRCRIRYGLLYVETHAERSQ